MATTRLGLSATPGRPYAAFIAKEAFALPGLAYVTFSQRSPAVSFVVKYPTITFTASGPAVAWTVKE